MSGLRSTLQRVLRRVPNMGSSMVIGPSDVTKNTYDLLIVDESHRLRRRVNLTNFPSYDSANRKLGLEKNATQLDWIVAASKKQIINKLQIVSTSLNSHLTRQGMMHSI